MHALAGIISPVPDIELPRLAARMARRLCHDRSHLIDGTSLAQVGLHVGWVAAHAKSADPTPAWSGSKRVGIILAGETPGSERQSWPSKARVADNYEAQGVAALAELNGVFSGVVIDLRDETVTVFNDRYGLSRIYYHDAAAGFFFASEAKALLTALPHLRQFSPRGLAEWFAVGCVLQNRSLFHGVSILPPASAWKFRRDGRVEKHTYFDPRTWEAQPVLSASDYNERLCEIFSRLGRRYLGGASQAAISLTGGLDSRAVLAWARPGAGSLPCYTFGGPYRDCADVVIARRLARLCRMPHTTIQVGREFFSGFDQLAEQSVYLSDGTMDASGAVELHVNDQARAIAPVRLTGNYGSEILRSHVAFRPGRLDRSLFTPDFNALIDEAGETYRHEATGHRLSFIAFKQVPWHHHSRFSLEKSRLTPRSPFLDHELVALAYRAPAELRTSPQPLLNLIARGNPRLSSIATDRALRVQRMTMASRVAHSWQEFTAKAEYAYDYGMPRWLARADRVMTPLHLERLFLGRHKFYHFRVWYRDQLRESVRQQAAAAGQTAPFCYRPDASRRVVDEHLSGAANRTLELHKLLGVQLVERLLLRQS